MVWSDYNIGNNSSLKLMDYIEALESSQSIKAENILQQD